MRATTTPTGAKVRRFLRPHNAEGRNLFSPATPASVSSLTLPRECYALKGICARPESQERSLPHVVLVEPRLRPHLRNHAVWLLRRKIARSIPQNQVSRDPIVTRYLPNVTCVDDLGGV